VAARKEAETQSRPAIAAPLLDPPRRTSALRRAFAAVPWRIVGPILSVALFVGALYVLATILHEVSPDDVVAAFAATPSSAIAISVGFTFLSYLALTGYDGLALRQIGAESIPYSTAAIGSFTSYAISYTLGLPLLTAGTVRYRVYGGAGLTAPQIAALTLVCTLTFWLGMGGVLALGLLFVPDAVNAIDRMPNGANAVVGAAILAAILAYVVYVSSRRRVVTVEGWSLPLPGGRVTVIQILLGVFDVCAGAGALYVLLPGEAPTPFLTFDVIYVLAAVLGVASHAPGGIGVFEATILLALPSIPRDQLLGSILLYRVIYYFVPFALALATLGAYEVARRRHLVDRLVEQASGVMMPLAPILVAGAVFIAGAAMMITGSLPVGAGRRSVLWSFAPLSVIEVAHLASAVIGVALMFLARGLLRRLASAWFSASALLGLAVVLTVLRGADLRLAVAGLCCLVVVLLSRAAFPRRARLFDQEFSLIQIGAIATVVALSAYVGLFAFRAIPYEPALWSRFGLAEDFPRVLRGLAAAGLATLAIGAVSFRRREQVAAAAVVLDLEAIVGQSARADARLALLPDRTILASDSRDAVMMTALRGQSSIALGDPIGPSQRAQDLLWAFRERAERQRLWPVVVSASRALAPLYLEAGLTLTHIGDTARVDLAALAPEPFAGAATIAAWGDREALSLDLVPAGAVEPLLPALKAISDAWLLARDHQEGYFTLGRWSESWILANDCAVLRRAGNIVGFAVVLRGAQDIEWTVDILRYQPELGLKALDFILLGLLRLARGRGVRRFDLGLTPTPDLSAENLSPTWRRVTPMLFRFGDHFRDFEALRRFKARFSPTFEPRFLAGTAGFALPHVLLDVTALIEDGPMDPDHAPRRAPPRLG
jgi:phosphatidylglycerol lysyltransferase